MANAWIEHIRKYAKDNNMKYSAALTDPKCKASYKGSQGKGVNPFPIGSSGEKATKLLKEAARAIGEIGEKGGEKATNLLKEAARAVGQGIAPKENVSMTITEKKKRGRPRKYSSPEEAKKAKTTKTIESNARKTKAKKQAEPSVEGGVLPKANIIPTATASPRSTADPMLIPRAEVSVPSAPASAREVKLPKIYKLFIQKINDGSMTRYNELMNGFVSPDDMDKDMEESFDFYYDLDPVVPTQRAKKTRFEKSYKYFTGEELGRPSSGGMLPRLPPTPPPARREREEPAELPRRVRQRGRPRGRTSRIVGDPVSPARSPSRRLFPPPIVGDPVSPTRNEINPFIAQITPPPSPVQRNPLADGVGNYIIDLISGDINEDSLAEFEEVNDEIPDLEVRFIDFLHTRPDPEEGGEGTPEELAMRFAAFQDALRPAAGRGLIAKGSLTHIYPLHHNIIMDMLRDA